MSRLSEIVAGISCFSVLAVVATATWVAIRPTAAHASSGPPNITDHRDCAQAAAVADYFFAYDPQEHADAQLLGPTGVADVKRDICGLLAGARGSEGIIAVLDQVSAKEKSALIAAGELLLSSGAMARSKAAGASSDDLILHPEKYMSVGDAEKVRTLLVEEARAGAKARIIGWILYSVYGLQYAPK